MTPVYPLKFRFTVLPKLLKNGIIYWVEWYEKKIRKLSSFLIINDWNVSVPFGTPCIIEHIKLRTKRFIKGSLQQSYSTNPGARTSASSAIHRHKISEYTKFQFHKISNYAGSGIELAKSFLQNISEKRDTSVHSTD